jgi:hypothetical protein
LLSFAGASERPAAREWVFVPAVYFVFAEALFDWNLVALSVAVH